MYSKLVSETEQPRRDLKKYKQRLEKQYTCMKRSDLSLQESIKYSWFFPPIEANLKS